MQLQQRDYQDRVVDKVVGFFEAGDRTVMMESPTGSGKTIMAHRVLRHFEQRHGLTANWVAMRRNLLQQVRETNDRFFGLGKLTPVSMFDKNPPPADITVVDEAQHDAAASCVHVHEKSRSRFILGLSATPYRTDTLKLAFKRVVKDAGIHRLIQDGWLCPYHHWSIEKWTPQSVAGTYLAEPQRWGKSVAFFLTLDECREFANILQNAGHRCEVITADTNREAQLDAFDAGQFRIVANVAILNEGFDCPDLRTVFVRDASRLPTVQMAGRGFRTHEGKPHCNIVQSTETRWPFTRTAQPQRSYCIRDGRWFCLQSSDLVEATARRMAQKIAGTQVHMPEYLLKKTRPGHPGPLGEPVFQRWAGRPRRIRRRIVEQTTGARPGQENPPIG
jgi:superfamily II DNA or RNA helicase